MLNRKNTELTGALTALRGEFDNHEVANEYWCKDIEDRLEDLESVDVNDLEYRINEFESRIDDLESVNSELLESRVVELEGQVDAQANIIRDLELALAELIARIAKLEVK